MQYIQRYAEKRLGDMFSSNKVLMILGARQVGKTTLLEHLLTNPTSVFLNLDTEVDQARLLATKSLPPSDALKTF